MSATEANSSGEARLRIVASDDGDRVGEEILVDGEVTIGREDECSITLSETTISRRHAKVELTPEGLKVTDLNSGNGVWSDGQRVEELVLTPGQRFQIGTTTFEWPAPVVEDEPEVVEIESDAEATVFFNPAEHGVGLDREEDHAAQDGHRRQVHGLHEREHASRGLGKGS